MHHTVIMEETSVWRVLIVPYVVYFDITLCIKQIVMIKTCIANNIIMV